MVQNLPYRLPDDPIDPIDPEDLEEPAVIRPGDQAQPHTIEPGRDRWTQIVDAGDATGQMTDAAPVWDGGDGDDALAATEDTEAAQVHPVASFDPTEFGASPDYVFGDDRNADQALIARLYEDGDRSEGHRARIAVEMFHLRAGELKAERGKALSTSEPDREAAPVADPLRAVRAADKPTFETLSQTLPMLVSLQATARQARQSGDERAADAADALAAQLESRRAETQKAMLGWLGKVGENLRPTLAQLENLEAQRSAFDHAMERGPNWAWHTNRQSRDRLAGEIVALRTSIEAQTDAALHVAENLGALNVDSADIPAAAAPFFAPFIRTQAQEEALQAATTSALDALDHMAASETAKTLPERLELATRAAESFAHAAALRRRSEMSEIGVAFDRFGEPALKALDLAATLFPEVKVAGPLVKGAGKTLSALGRRRAASVLALGLLAAPEAAHASLLKYTARQLVDRPFDELAPYAGRWLLKQGGRLHHPLSFGIFRDVKFADPAWHSLSMTMPAESLADVVRAYQLDPSSASDVVELQKYIRRMKVIADTGDAHAMARTVHDNVITPIQGVLQRDAARRGLSEAQILSSETSRRDYLATVIRADIETLVHVGVDRNHATELVYEGLANYAGLLLDENKVDFSWMTRALYRNVRK